MIQIWSWIRRLPSLKLQVYLTGHHLVSGSIDSNLRIISVSYSVIKLLLLSPIKVSMSAKAGEKLAKGIWLQHSYSRLRNYAIVVATPLAQWNSIILSAFNTLEWLTLSRNNLLLPFFKIGKEKITLSFWFKKWQKTFYPLFSKQSWKMWQIIIQLNLECCIYSHWCHADLASLSYIVKLRVQSIKRVKERRRVLLALCPPPLWSNLFFLVSVDKPFDFNYAVSPVCLPDSGYCNPRSRSGDVSDDLMSPLPGHTCISAGWGVTKPIGGAQPDQLREVRIPVLHKCKDSHWWTDIQYQVRPYRNICLS